MIFSLLKIKPLNDEDLLLKFNYKLQWDVFKNLIDTLELFAIEEQELIYLSNKKFIKENFKKLSVLRKKVNRTELDKAVKKLCGLGSYSFNFELLNDGIFVEIKSFETGNIVRFKLSEDNGLLIKEDLNFYVGDYDVLQEERRVYFEDLYMEEDLYDFLKTASFLDNFNIIRFFYFYRILDENFLLKFEDNCIIKSIKENKEIYF